MQELLINVNLFVLKKIKNILCLDYLLRYKDIEGTNYNLLQYLIDSLGFIIHLVKYNQIPTCFNLALNSFR